MVVESPPSAEAEEFHRVVRAMACRQVHPHLRKKAAGVERCDESLAAACVTGSLEVAAAPRVGISGAVTEVIDIHQGSEQYSLRAIESSHRERHERIPGLDNGDIVFRLKRAKRKRQAKSGQ